MAITTDRVGEFIEGPARNRRTLVSPEGVLLDIQVAGNIERVSAFLLDIVFMFTAIILLYIVAIMLFFTRTNISVGMTLMLFIAFVVRNCYFLHFELAWQGRTPGKKICGLRVINRSGGELTPSAVVARNLTREVEFFLPFSVLLTLGLGDGFWTQLTLLGWVLAIASLPLWGRAHLRAGDLIGGAQVYAKQRRVLLADLTRPGQRLFVNKRLGAATYTFSHEQLAIYGAFELQVLEEFLRRPQSGQTDKILYDVSVKIRNKIGWKEEIPFADIRKFLTDFYAAERAELERDKLYGRLRADKTDRA